MLIMYIHTQIQTIPTIETFKPAIKAVFPYGTNHITRTHPPFPPSCFSKTLNTIPPHSAGTHHSKWALLWYEGGLRVMITTANYIQMDWENKTEARIPPVVGHLSVLSCGGSMDECALVSVACVARLFLSLTHSQSLSTQYTKTTTGRVRARLPLPPRRPPRRPERVRVVCVYRNKGRNRLAHASAAFIIRPIKSNKEANVTSIIIKMLHSGSARTSGTTWPSSIPGTTSRPSNVRPSVRTFVLIYTYIL